MTLRHEEVEAVFGPGATAETVRQRRQTPPAATRELLHVRAGDESAVVKVIWAGGGSRRWPASPDPADPWYWRREELAYRSGLFELVAPLRAPALLASFERPDGSVALWLEDVPEAPRWTPERLGGLAEKLGAAQAALAADPPGEPWLARGWLRSYLALRELDPELSAGAEAKLARLDALPQTLVHNDLHPGNVLGADGDVVVDWAYCGLGAVGLDAGVLAVDALFDAVVDLALADRVVAAVWEGYAAGLGSPADEARWAYLGGTALRLSWMPVVAALPGSPPRYAELVPLLHRLAAAALRL